MATTSTAKKDLKYFMRESAKTEEIVTAPGPDTILDEDGKVIELEIKILNQAAIQKINEGYRKRSIATDKKGQPYIANGEVVFKVEKDSGRAVRHIIAEALVYPNLKDPELMKFFECQDITEMALKVFPRADEYAHVSRVVMAALGMGPAEAPQDDDSEVNDAKN